MDLFPDNDRLQKWMRGARERIAFQGLPARICWLGYGERDKAGLRVQRPGAPRGELSARRSSSAATTSTAARSPRPYRETESMLDGSDAIADWPLLNALVNTASGASWVSIHHGGGVGIGRSIHAGQVSLADGTALAAEKLARVLTNDPGMGVIRHVDAGYDRADRGRRGARRPHPDARGMTARSAQRWSVTSASLASERPGRRRSPCDRDAASAVRAGAEGDGAARRRSRRRRPARRGSSRTA